MSNRIPEECECLHKVDPTLRFDICDRERCMRGDLLDRLRASIAVFGNDEEPSLRRCVGHSDCDLWIFHLKNSEVFSEPVLFFIEAMWWMEIHERYSQIRCDGEDFINLLLGHATFWSGDTEDVDPRYLYEIINIFWITRIKFFEINREIDTIILGRLCEEKYLVKSIARKRCSGEEKQGSYKLIVKNKEWIIRCEFSILEHTPFFDNFQILLFISYTSDTIFAESYFFAVENFLDHFLIGAQCGITTLEFEEDDIPESSLGETIEDDVVASLPDEDHILRCIGKVRKCRKNLLIEFSEDLILRSSHG